VLPPVAVDVHCHTFCSADLPIVGFVAHFIPGLTELSRFVSHWPELVVRTFVGAVATLPNAVAPSGEAELAMLRAALAQPAAGPLPAVPTLPPELLEALLGELTKHLPFSVSADKRRIIVRYLETLYLVAHPRVRHQVQRLQVADDDAPLVGADREGKVLGQLAEQRLQQLRGERGDRRQRSGRRLRQGSPQHGQLGLAGRRDGVRQRRHRAHEGPHHQLGPVAHEA